MKTKIPHAEAKDLALDLLADLRPYCHRIEIAGSIRRGKPMVGDIEIVAVPLPWQDLFGPAPLETDHALNHIDWERYGALILNGPKQKKVQLHQGVQLDLFIVTPPAEWGVIFTLRTGPQEYSTRLVTIKQQGGLLPSCFRVQDGAIWSRNHIIPTPEEDDVFRVLGLPWVEPGARR